MSLAIGKTIATTQVGLDEMNALIGTTGFIRVYTSVNPADPDSAEPSGQVGSFSMASPAFLAATDAATRAQAVAGAIQPDISTGAGTVVAWRIYTASTGGTCIYQGDAGKTGDDASLLFDENIFQTGGTATISGFTIYLDQ